MYILGLHTSHDTSACLLKDGEIVIAIEKERLTRHKHQWGNNDLSLIVDYCLSGEGISLSDIDLVVVNDINNIFKEKIFCNNEYLISHHLAHAWAAVGLSPYNTCAVLILDGEGSKVIELSQDERDICNNNIDFYAEKESCYIFKNNNLFPVQKITSGRGGDSKFSGTDATGSPYWLLSQLFFDKEHQESKIMGLSTYGINDGKLSKIFSFLPDGKIVIDKHWIFDFVDFPKNKLNENFQLYADIAANIQNSTEEAIIHKAKWLKEELDTDNLCFSGGVALNCVANARLKKEKVYDNVFVPFGAGDSSIAIGCAYYGWHVLANKQKVMSKISPYLGKRYSDSIIKESIEPFLKHRLIRVSKEINYLNFAAEYLNEGKIIGWFQDKSEFGPRALGNRSIIASPAVKNIRTILNNKVKYRESFRPFAPSVIEEKASEWFDNIIPQTYFMQFTANVKKEKINEIPEVTHVDGSARIQLVSQDLNPIFYDLLTEFYKISGIPILLNTSFNIQEPIVESPTDALLTFVTSSIDYLFLHDNCIENLTMKVTEKDELLTSTCFIVVHKSFQIRYLAPSTYSVQITTGMEKNFRFGNHYQISNFDDFSISNKLYQLCHNIKLLQGELHEVSEMETKMIYDVFDELKFKFIEQRIISIIKIK